jgi:hypothetical protein
MSPVLMFFGLCLDLACGDEDILPCHRPGRGPGAGIFVSVPGRGGYGVGRPLLFDDVAANDEPAGARREVST